MKRADRHAAKNFAIRKERIWELDFLRGICVLLMIFDHAMFDIYGIFGESWAAAGGPFLEGLYAAAQAYWVSPVRTVTEPLVVIVFCVLCGISCSFSRNNLKRGLEVGVCALIVFGVTTAIEQPIRFGILQMFTVAILSWWLIDVCCRHDKLKTAFACLGIGVAIVFVNMALMNVYNGGAAPGKYPNNPQAFVSDNRFAWIGEFLYGDIYSDFSADYQPIFPLVGYMLIGAAFAPVLYPRRRSLLPLLGKYDWYKPFNIWGKIALPVYVLHQALIAVIFALISYFWLTPGDFIII